MLKARIIPCLDVRQGRTVKGVGFQNLVDSGDPVALGLAYAEDGADELVWLEIAATTDGTPPALALIDTLRQRLKIPLTVGGGITSQADAAAYLQHGADKVSINTAAVNHPALISDIAQRWGSQCVVVAIDVTRQAGRFLVRTHGGRNATGRELGAWLKEAEERGAGEFLLTSIDRDGRQSGYDIELLDFARHHTSRPIIASGGAGSVDDLAAAIARGHQALLIASLLHQGKSRIASIKRELNQRGYAVRV